MEADIGLTNMAMGDNPRYSADNTLLVRFFKHPRQNEAKSKEEGRPIFEETDYIQIMQPGNKDSIVTRPATMRDKDRFAEHYRKYQAREDDDHIEGTLLEQWPGMSRAQVEEFKFLNIRTVEQLANMSDSNAQGIMGINTLKQKAAAYLEAAKDSAVVEQLAEQKNENDELRKLVAELSTKVEVLSEAQAAPKRRTRARKTDEDADAA